MNTGFSVFNIFPFKDSLQEYVRNRLHNPANTQYDKTPLLCVFYAASLYV